MAQFKATILSPLTRDEAFDYLSDFSTAEEWDPSCVRGERLSDGPLGVGSQFRIVAEFLGRETELTYSTVEQDEPRAVAFRAESSTTVSHDRITFDETRFGTRVHYEANLGLKGPLRLADPLLAIAFRRTCGNALGGLRRVLRESEGSRAHPLTEQSCPRSV